MKRTLLFLAVAAAGFGADPAPLFRTELLFPMEKWHNHSSSVVEIPGGDLLVCWFHGSGERTADDVEIRAARWSKGAKSWSAPFQLADTPGFPDTNPVLFLDRGERLWFFWPAILANTWESALMKYKTSVDYRKAGPPKWDDAGNILLIPRRLTERTQELLETNRTMDPQEVQKLIAMSKDKLSARLGWFTRTHPLQLPSGRVLLPLYSDGFSFGLIAISDDGGKSWTASEPIVGDGNIQPSLVRKKDGTLVAYMRDNGPPPKRIHRSTSRDDGLTWTPAEDSDLPNPGSSLEAVGLRDGTWLLVYNDLEKGRHSLAVSMSDDEGQSWKWTRHIERDEQRNSSFHYPSIIQARDGTIHVTYSYFRNDLPEGAPRKAIKHAHFNTAWVKASGKQP